MITRVETIDLDLYYLYASWLCLCNVDLAKDVKVTLVTLYFEIWSMAWNFGSGMGSVLSTLDVSVGLNLYLILKIKHNTIFCC